MIRSAFRRAQAWAVAHPNDPEVIDAMTWPVLDVMASYYPFADNEIGRTYDLLTEKKAFEGDRVAFLCAIANMSSYANPAAKRFLVTALEQSKSKTIRGICCLSLGATIRDLRPSAESLDDPLIRDLAIKAHSPVPRGFLDQIKQADPDALDREAEVYFDASSTSSATLRSPSPAHRRRWARPRAASYSNCATSS